MEQSKAVSALCALMERKMDLPDSNILYAFSLLTPFAFYFLKRLHAIQIPTRI